MITRVSCISVDLVNADKPPAALAFLAGACEQTNKIYQCISLNSDFISNLSTDQYNKIYSELKIGNINFLTTIQSAVDNIINDVKTFDPDTILISLFSYMQYPLAMEFLTILRQQLPAVEILAGGPGINHSHNGVTNGYKLLQAGLLDYYCLGEGDEVLLEFLNGNKDVLGINCKKYNHESYVPQIDDLENKYVMPSYQKIPLHNYHNIENKKSTIFSLSTSRGCVRSCSFCDVAETWKKFRFRSGKSVAQEVLKHHNEVGAVNFTIVDSLINGSLKSFHEFNLEMIQLKEQHPGLKEFSYNGMFIVRDQKAHKEDLFKSMQQAGCDSLAIGVETGSERLRNEMNKKFTNADLDYHLEMCSKYGIRNSLFMFVGYPTETDDDFSNTLDMLDRYQKYLIDNTIIGINHSGVFGILPGTPVYSHKDDIGIVFTNTVDDLRLQWNNINNPTLTIKKRIDRDLALRRRAIELRYPIPYANRYLEHLKQLGPEFVPVSD